MKMEEITISTGVTNCMTPPTVARMRRWEYLLLQEIRLSTEAVTDNSKSEKSAMLRHSMEEWWAADTGSDDICLPLKERYALSDAFVDLSGLVGVKAYVRRHFSNECSVKCDLSDLFKMTQALYAVSKPIKAKFLVWYQVDENSDNRSWKRTPVWRVRLVEKNASCPTIWTAIPPKED